MGPAPLFSFLLPARDAQATLPAALASLLAQDFPSHEVIAVDDGSTDGTRALLEAFAASDARVRVISQPPLGIVETLNRAANEARGALLARMDADDVARPGRLTAQLALLDADPRLVLCGGGVEIIGEDVRPGRREYAAWINSHHTHDEIDRALFIECPIAHPAFLMRREAFEAADGYRAFDGPEDHDLVLRLWAAGGRLANAGEVVLDWRESPGRLSRVDGRYSPEAFRRLKREWLRRTILPPGTPFQQWGAGAVGKRWLREWDDVTGRPSVVVDVDPRKVGSMIHGTRVIAPDELDPHAAFTVVAVGAPGARDLIRAWMRERGAREGEQYRFLA
jgi:glycosyltransferase involved in cell wall biosynthesis